jgi:Uma2 family endonuclease
VTAARKLATYDDLRALPEDARGEVVRGEVVVAPAPLPRHSRVQGALRSFIGKPFDDDDGAGGPGGWWILLDVDVRLGPHDVVRPDLSGWRRARLPEPWDQRPIDVVPDWVCEVTSPSNARHDRVTKARLYLDAGVPFYWLVDPETRVLEALVRDGARWVEAGRFTDGDVAPIPPFEAIALDVGRLFPPATPTPAPATPAPATPAPATPAPAT